MYKTYTNITDLGIYNNYKTKHTSYIFIYQKKNTCTKYSKINYEFIFINIKST